MTLRIVVTGKTGQVGKALCARLKGDHKVITLGRNDLDLETWEITSSLIDACVPDLIINAAAYTDVEKAEDEEDIAYRINTELPERLAKQANRHNAGFIHFSTDYVFDGTKLESYIETDIPNPINAYGRSKLGAEQKITASCDAWIIARLSWVYAETGKNFLNTMISLFTKQQTLKVVADQSGAPTPASVIADIVARIIDQAPPGQLQSYLTEHSGILHIACRGHTSWWEFAKKIADLDAENTDEESEDELEDVDKSLKSKVGGYLKDGFIVDVVEDESDNDMPDENEILELPEEDYSDEEYLSDMGSELEEEDYYYSDSD